VARYSPESDAKPHFQKYEVPLRGDWMVLDALNYIKDKLDGSLTYRWSCRMGICGSCGMVVNGYERLTCETLLAQFAPGPVRIEPLRHFPIARDLVIDMTDFLEKLTRVKPWIVRKDDFKPEREFFQTPAQMETYHQFSLCINCTLCYAACPVYGLNNEFLGPAAIALARRYNLDSRDQGLKQRLPVIGDSEGVWECSFVGECSVVCPKGVDPAKAIQQTKLDTTLRFVLPYGNRED